MQVKFVFGNEARAAESTLSTLNGFRRARSNSFLIHFSFIFGGRKPMKVGT